MKTIVLIVFTALLNAGIIVPQGDNEGRPLYTVYPDEGKVIEYAYKGEIFQWISTGFSQWKWNEDFSDTYTSDVLTEVKAE